MTNSQVANCQNSIVWDAHAGVFPSQDNNLELLLEWHQSGVNHVSINVGFDVMDWQQTLQTLKYYRSWILKNSEKFILSSTVDDINRAKAENKLSVAFDIEGMNALNGDLSMLKKYHALGVRQMLFAYNLNNDAGGGCHDKEIGLTDFGRKIVTEMNRIGMIIDCSHASKKSSFDIMEQSTRPVVFTHSNPNAVWKHQRNITDEQIVKCAETGGVVGVNGMGIFLGDNDTSLETVLKHVVYIAELVGPNYVGFGLDYSPEMKIDVGAILASRPDYWPKGNLYDTPKIKHLAPFELASIADELSVHGFSSSEVQGILGQNFYRVASTVWQTPN